MFSAVVLWDLYKIVRWHHLMALLVATCSGVVAVRPEFLNCELAALVVACSIHDQQDMRPGKLLGQGVQEDLEAFRIR